MEDNSNWIEFVKLLWDVLKTLAPYVKRRIATWRGERGQWSRSVRAGAKALGTPAEEIEELLFLLSNPAFDRPKGNHPLVKEITYAINVIKLRLDELNLLAQAESSSNPERQCQAIREIGRRSGEYFISSLQSISDGLHYTDDVRETAREAIAAIKKRMASDS